MLADLGSRINLIGRNTLERFISNARKHGHTVSLQTRERPIQVHGVGQGAAVCTEQATIPVAVKYKDRSPQIHPFIANVADGHGSDLPAILGKDSMEARDAVIILREGNKCMAFPGPGGYRIEWSAGTKIVPMEDSPSGHLVIPCDTFEKAEVVKDTHAFFTDNMTSDSSHLDQTAVAQGAPSSSSP